MKQANKEVDTGTIKSEESNVQLAQIPTGKLTPFKHHIFKPYSAQRMKTLAASVQENGIIHPIIVRVKAMKKGDNPTMLFDEYEIISGHNRVEAAKLAGLKVVPAVVKELTDDEAVFLANEANIESRSFSTWLPSEKIKSINQYHAAAKNQGKKNPNLTSGDNRQKTEDNYARQRTAQVYGQSASQIRNFIELSHLTESLLDRLDAEDFGTTPASELSFISPNGQELINSVLDEDKDKKLYKVTVRRSVQLRKFFEDDADESQIKEMAEVIKDGIRKILNNSKDTTSETALDAVKIPISQEEFAELFPDAPSPEDIAEYMVRCARYCIEKKVVQREEVD